MESARAALSREHRERLKQERQFARQIMFVADQAFADRTERVVTGTWLWSNEGRKGWLVLRPLSPPGNSETLRP